MEIDNLKKSLQKCIDVSDMGDDVIKALLPNHMPHDFETEYWDYKQELPVVTVDQDKKEFDYKIHTIIKDIVSFHNSYGGYLVFGVKNKGMGTDRVVGCQEILDCDDLLKRIKAYTGKDIQCYFRQFSLMFSSGVKHIGLLFIPRRKSNEQPVSFIKPGPEWKGEKAYSKNSVYMRRNNQCIPAASSSEDWGFLLSDRIISNSNLIVPRVQNNLPSRDQDLIEFVGRSEELEKLRIWTLDNKSPIRLLTGIGGLGKTSIAYKFAEEVCALGSVGVDAVVWVTAKKETFSALRGQMVSTTRHDFSNTKELLQQLVVNVCGESSVEEDMDTEELVEVLIEGLLYSPSLIIVDDLDSLTPEDQKDCASILQQVALRTVGREHPLSRFLLTSRLDQGMPPTAVIKVSGLSKDDFDLHLKNLCAQFGIDSINRQIQNKIFSISSGSPLFASSIVRMASLGEPLNVICDSWADADGEDVRAFAFKRELERLSSNAAAVLLTILRLGSSGLSEISDIVEMPKKSLQGVISELQQYHLLSRSEDKFKEVIFTASKELIAVTDIVRNKIGARANEIDKECAKVRKRQGDQSRNVGILIKKAVSLWADNQPNEALLVAENLAKEYPGNADVFCVLGRAYMSLSLPRFADADKSLSKALSLNCQRPELFQLVVKAKAGIQDWRELRNYTYKKTSRNSNDDPVLDAHMLANANLYNLAYNVGRYKDAADYALEIVQRISAKIEGQYLQPVYFEKIRKEHTSFSTKYVEAMRGLNSRAGDMLEVVNAVFNVCDLNVYSPNLVINACEYLKAWFSDVEKRPIVDGAALDILQDKLSRLRKIQIRFSLSFGDNDRAVKIIDSAIKELEFRGGNLSRV